MIGNTVDDLTHAFARDGYCVLPGFLDAAEVARYRALCDCVLGRWRVRHPDTETTNIAWLTAPDYWRDDPNGLRALLEFVAADQITDLLEALGGSAPLFNNTQYFFEPMARRWEGQWHRDCQFLVTAEADEAALRTRFRGVHFRVAFGDDDNLLYVPGSHRRADSAAEHDARFGEHPRPPNLAGQAIALRAGDAAAFDAWGIHRGRYRPGVPRRTFDVVLQWGPPQMEAIPPPTCFGDDTVLDSLSAQARRFFGRFAAAHRPCWARGRHVVPDR